MENIMSLECILTRIEYCKDHPHTFSSNTNNLKPRYLLVVKRPEYSENIQYIYTNPHRMQCDGGRVFPKFRDY